MMKIIIGNRVTIEVHDGISQMCPFIGFNPWGHAAAL
jgi:hypothetical protein